MDGKLPEIFVLNSKCLMAEEFGTLFTRARILTSGNGYAVRALDLGLNPEASRALGEVMSLGLLSRWYGNLKPGSTRRAIARVYGLDDGVLQSWLQHLTYVRNLCAHHSRLWNRDFTITPELPRSKPARLAAEFVPGSRKLYNTLVMLLHLMDVISPQHHWRQHLTRLIGLHCIPSAPMGFVSDWSVRPIWQEGQL